MTDTPSLTDDQIKHLVNRFLGWRLPEDFNPDDGISFTPTFNDHLPGGPMKRNPTGTNLFDYRQAEAMVRHMIDGMPDGLVISGASWATVTLPPDLVEQADASPHFDESQSGGVGARYGVTEDDIAGTFAWFTSLDMAVAFAGEQEQVFDLVTGQRVGPSK